MQSPFDRMKGSGNKKIILCPYCNRPLSFKMDTDWMKGRICKHCNQWVSLNPKDYEGESQ